MPGAVDVDLGLDDSALDTEFSIGGTELLLFKQMGKATVDGIQLRFTGSIQRDDTGKVGRGACRAWTSQRSGFRRVEDGRKQHHKVTSTNSCAATTSMVRCSMKWTLSTW